MLKDDNWRISDSCEKKARVHTVCVCDTQLQQPHTNLLSSQQSVIVCIHHQEHLLHSNICIGRSAWLAVLLKCNEHICAWTPTPTHRSTRKMSLDEETDLVCWRDFLFLRVLRLFGGLMRGRSRGRVGCSCWGCWYQRVSWLLAIISSFSEIMIDKRISNASNIHDNDTGEGSEARDVRGGRTVALCERVN